MCACVISLTAATVLFLCLLPFIMQACVSASVEALLHCKISIGNDERMAQKLMTEKNE